MLSNKVKALISEVIGLYSTSTLSQSIINMGAETLKEAKKLLLNEDEPIERTEPITLEELEALFPSEPEYPELQLQSNFDVEVELKSDLLSLNVEEGTIVKTRGYYSLNDGGQAVYEIMSYDNWWNQLPLDLKLVTYHNDRLNAGPIFYKNPADNFGNHKLKNGMIAKLLPNLDGYVRVEQWGLFENRYDNCRALVHCFANNLINSKILFPKNNVYTFYNSWITEVRNRKEEIFFSTAWWVDLDNVCSNGNEYAIIHNSKTTQSPVIGNARNLEICGNGATLRWGDGQVNSSFALIESGGFVDGLKIHGLILDGNSRNQLYNMDLEGNYIRKEKTASTGMIYYEYEKVTTRAHGISYFSNGIQCNTVDANGYILDGNNKNTGILFKELKNYLGVEDLNKTTFNNV